MTARAGRTPIDFASGGTTKPASGPTEAHENGSVLMSFLQVIESNDDTHAARWIIIAFDVATIRQIYMRRPSILGAVFVLYAVKLLLRL